MGWWCYWPLTASVAWIAPPFPTSGFTSSPSLNFILPLDPELPNKFPGHLQPVFDATEQLLAPLTTLVCEPAGSHRRVVVVHDMLMSVAARAAAESLNSESYSYRCSSACSAICFRREEDDHPEPVVPGLSPLILRSFINESFMDVLARAVRFQHLDRGLLFNTFHSLEGQFLSKIAQRSPGLHVWALDEQAPQSVVYVAFGTTVSVEVRELAQGLEPSGQPFLWVLRDADKGDVFARREAEGPQGLPEGYEGRGLIVRDWAPQLEILRHPSTGGFFTHCRWNSCVESFAMGIPIVTWPLHSDQPVNAQLVTGVLGVGVALKEWHERDDIVRTERVERAVRKLMVFEEGGGDEEEGGGAEGRRPKGGGRGLAPPLIPFSNSSLVLKTILAAIYYLMHLLDYLTLIAFSRICL
ncbi:hypothetical protein AMTR_s00039p00077780 [Amborella trichopoda]|uniref:Glycosyltransferase N-terminal domain-containing protein n=1 Tax=Amborella trichopoda TaxID=13333 RepID=U5D5X3_AMBTC|nr:hypothetical protein AMTR_s00039p00077780 [Amborella trichopoda]